MAEMSRSAASSDTDLQVIRGSRLSSKFSDYLVLDLIGKGAFAKVAKCVKSVTNETVAVRIMKKTHSDAEKEDGILQKLRGFDPDVWNFVRWNSSFTYKAHLCQEFELLDMSLKEFVNMRQTSSLPLKEVQPILYQVVTALRVLKSLGIAHTDLKPENIMLVDHVRQPLKVKLIDFGSACDASEAQQGSYIQHRWYRAPETILGVPCNEAIDMWSLGCIAAELFQGVPLYPGCCEYEMIWKITQTQGQLPGYFLSAGLKTSQFYRKTWPNMWKLMTPHEYGRVSWIDCMFSSLDDLKNIQQEQDSHDLGNFVELVKEMLQLDPTQRITPSQVLQHPFFITTNQLKDFCMSSDEVESNQASTRSSCGAQSPQNTLWPSEEDASITAHIKPLEKRKRAHAEISKGCKRSPGGTSPVRKKRKICEGRPLVKRPYGEISKGCKRIPEIFSPERKKRKICRGRPLINRLFCEISKGSKMTADTEEKDTELPSTSEEAPSTMIQVKSKKRKWKALTLQSDARTSESTLKQEEERKATHTATKIWIIGSSYVRRGEKAAYQKFGENFGLKAKVEWFGRGGMRWSGVLPCFYAELSNTQSPPDILVIHAGGNDLGLMSANKLASVMTDDLTQLRAEFPSMAIVYSCINEQQVWRNGQPRKVNVHRKNVNKHMTQAVGNFGGEVIEHPLLRYSEQKLFLADGVHFTKKGNEIFVTSIHHALTKILQKSHS